MKCHNLARNIYITLQFFQAMMQEIFGRMPLVQAVQETGHSLVRNSLFSVLKLEFLGIALGILCVLDPLRSGVVTLHLTTSGSVWMS